MNIEINGRSIGADLPVYVVAEMSANHNGEFEEAVRIVEAAKQAGADAIKLQTYTPDTITLDCDNDYFRVKGTIWEGKNLYELYGEAYTPWDWQPKLKEVAGRVGLDFFSTPIDVTAVDFLEDLGVPAYKVASFELVDIPLLEKIGSTGKPVIMSTGMATLDEIKEAMDVLERAGSGRPVLLKCTSAYPAPAAEMNLRAIPTLAEELDVPVGLSDHSLGTTAAIAAVALGACVVEKHFTLSRGGSSPDSAFSLEPAEFAQMAAAIREVEKALGKSTCAITAKENESRAFRKSLFVVEDMDAGDVFSHENIRSIRPGYGLHTRYLPDVLGKKAAGPIARGTPLSLDLVES
jgi:N-acetylneuraminate synthase